MIDFKYFLTIFSVIILILLFSISIYNANQKDLVEICNNDLSCVESLIHETNNFNFCSQITDNKTCYFDIAQHYNNSLLCDFSYNQSECNFNLAFKTKDFSLCKKTKISDKCIFQLGFYLNDINSCQLAQNKSFCYYSFALLKKNSSICYFSGSLENLCNRKLS